MHLEFENAELGSCFTPNNRITLTALSGLLICADVQCIVTNMRTNSDCSDHAVQMLEDYFGMSPQVVLFSSEWTVGPGDPMWWSVNVQKKVAEYGNVWLVAANTTDDDGKGGGIYEPDGVEVDVVDSSSPVIVYGELLLRGK